MKKFLITVLCIFLLVCSAGCSKKEENSAESDLPEVSDKAEQKQKKENKEDKTESEDIKESESDANTDDVIVDVPTGTEAPVIESAEELENIVNEFNDTEDPEKKEELRKKIEAFLAQAEAKSE